MFDRSFNGLSFDAHDGPVRCCSAVPRSNDCQSCLTRDKMEGDGCVDRTERVQLQPHAKLVAIQTEACPAVRSTQPANALHAFLYTIHTVSRWKRWCNCLDCHEFSSTPLRFRPHPRMPMQLSFRPHPRMQLQLHALCALSTTRLVCGNCLTVVAPWHSAAAPNQAVMGIKRRPVERPVEHACPEAPHVPPQVITGLPPIVSSNLIVAFALSLKK